VRQPVPVHHTHQQLQTRRLRHHFQVSAHHLFVVRTRNDTDACSSSSSRRRN
jgi:hypothetical protein